MSHTTVQLNAFYPGTFRAEFSTDGTTWTAFSNNVTLFAPAELSRPNEQMHAGGDNLVPVVTIGKLDKVTIRLRIFYLDQSASDLDRILIDRIRGTTPTLAVRWKPRGNVIGTVYATSVDGVTAGLVPLAVVGTPELNPNEAGPALIEVELVAPTIIRYLSGTSTGLGS